VFSQDFSIYTLENEQFALEKKNGWKMNTFLLWPCNVSGAIPGCVRKLGSKVRISGL